MKFFGSLLSYCGLIFLVSLVVISVSAQDVYGASLVDTIVGVDQFSVFTSFIHATGYDTLLNSIGPYTVFVVFDDVFYDLPADELDDLVSNVTLQGIFLQNHIVSGEYTTLNLFDGQVLSLLSGNPVVYSNAGDGSFNGIPIITSIPADNGVIHVLSDILSDSDCVVGDVRQCGDWSSVTICDRGWQVCELVGSSGVWTPCQFFSPHPYEICGDHIDNTCDGLVDTDVSGTLCVVGMETLEQPGVVIGGQTYYCGVADGICPEHFESPFGDEVVCSGAFVDVDCDDRSFIAFEAIGEQITAIQSVSSSMPNTHIIDRREFVFDSVYTAMLVIRGPSGRTETDIVFDATFSGVLEVVLIDRVAVDPCVADEVPCYRYNDTSKTLTLVHELSTHLIEIRFALQRGWFLLFIAIFGLILIPIIVIHQTRRNHSGKVELGLAMLKHKVKHPHDKTDNLKPYIEEGLEKGHSMKNIRVELHARGWSDIIIDKAIQEVYAKHNHVDGLEQYMRIAHNSGMSVDKQDAILREAGWSKEQIDEVRKRL